VTVGRSVIMTFGRAAMSVGWSVVRLWDRKKVGQSVVTLWDRKTVGRSVVMTVIAVGRSVVRLWNR
jgi:hypothetical protein